MYKAILVDADMYLMELIQNAAIRGYDHFVQQMLQKTKALSEAFNISKTQRRYPHTRWKNW
ncbi:MAG: hypothetical protein K0U40_00205 [Betaproteobacteria bacterium]|nr:hypothetical protein [Betaproteobacteria bacterium]